MIIYIILTSDQTHLTNFSGDKKAWPVYMTIGNLPASVRNSPSRLSTVLLALLPVPPKTGDVSHWSTKQNANIKSDCLHEVLCTILQPLKEVTANSIKMECIDFQKRICYPILAAWPADHMECIELFGIKSNSCPVCNITPDQLGYSIKELKQDPI